MFLSDSDVLEHTTRHSPLIRKNCTTRMPNYFTHYFQITAHVAHVTYVVSLTIFQMDINIHCSVSGENKTNEK